MYRRTFYAPHVITNILSIVDFVSLQITLSNMVHLNNNNGRGFTSQVMITDEKLQKKKQTKNFIKTLSEECLSGENPI